MPWVKGHLRDGRWVRGHYQLPPWRWLTRWGLVATVATDPIAQSVFWRIMGFLWLVIGVFVGGVILAAAVSKVADRTLRDPSEVPIDEAPTPAPVRVKPPRSARHREHAAQPRADDALQLPGDAGAPRGHRHRHHRR